MKQWLILSLLCLGLFACGKPKEDALVVGTIAGPETTLVETAKDEAFKRFGLRVKIVEFSDYNLPNEALRDGSLDANIYQHQPYLKAAMEARNYPFDVIGKTFVYPMGVYSQKHKTLKDIPEKAIIAIPNDPSNEKRALELLQHEGAVTIHANKHALNALEDIENPHQWVFKSIDAAQLPRILPDVDAAIINTTFAIPAGLHPSTDALVLESKDSPYANLVVIRSDSHKKKQLQQFVEALQSDAVKQKAKVLFQDGAIPAW